MKWVIEQPNQSSGWLARVWPVVRRLRRNECPATWHISLTAVLFFRSLPVDLFFPSLTLSPHLPYNLLTWCVTTISMALRRMKKTTESARKRRPIDNVSKKSLSQNLAMHEGIVSVCLFLCMDRH